MPSVRSTCFSAWLENLKTNPVPVLLLASAPYPEMTENLKCEAR